ncbi:putative nuclease HARBI1 [Harmonia axyridis]|uniref:putative nuclease HARBI1 n=1 Tax=Harmonia axyridis TaxID=115357 RepID=UPI001E276DB5|nr:putative nuclease HARBI1 [Harmonia axyridis]
MFMAELAEDSEEDEEEEIENIPRLSYETINPLNVLSETAFKKHFRLNKECFLSLLEEITPFVRARRRCKLELKTKLLVTLLFYAHGSDQSILGSSFFCDMSQSSVSRSIEEITNALTSREIRFRRIRFPRNMRELSQRRARFSEATHIPGSIGVIDCTHVAIIPPNDDQQVFVNRKKYHSMNVQLICEENCWIMNANPNFPGSSHNDYIWGKSDISGILQQVYRENGGNFFLLGDSEYPLSPWLLTPLRNPSSEQEERFNNKFNSARSIIERCNRLLKNRFRCLLKHRVLRYQPKKAVAIILACCVLHNICVENHIEAPEEDEEFTNADLGIIKEGNNSLVERNPTAQNDLRAARQLRQLIIENNFL